MRLRSLRRPPLGDLAAGIAALASAFAATAATGAEATRPLTFAVATFTHEATTFNAQQAKIEDFPLLRTTAEIAAANPGAEGFLAAIKDYSNVTVIPLESRNGPNGGSSKGWITPDAFETIASRMVDDLKRQGPVDGVFLALHGAAAVPGVRDPEAELARRVREVVGPGVPIIGEFDLHGNQDETFPASADASFVTKYFPHYDHRVQGERAARLMVKIAEGRYKPTTATRRPGIVIPTVYMWTGASPYSDIIQRALVWEARQPDAFVNVFFGFPWSDVANAGVTVEVTTNNDQALAARIAEDMSGYINRRRKALFGLTFVDAARLAPAVGDLTAAGKTPIVIADYSDRTGDATFVLDQVVRADMSGVLLATVRDQALIARLRQRGAKPGDAFDELVGGYLESPASGKPVRVKGTIRFFAPPPAGWAESAALDPVAVVAFGKDNLLVITADLKQLVDPSEMAFTGVDLSKVTSWVLKSRAHFRRGFDETGFAKSYVFAEPPGPYVGTIHLEKLPYRNLELAKSYPYNGKD